MSLTAPTNCWTLAEQKFMDALAASATFQAWGSYADATAAALAVVGSVERPEDWEPYPYAEREMLKARAIVFSALETPYGRQRTTGFRMEPYGVIGLGLELWRSVAEQTADGSHAETERLVKNMIGDLLEEIHVWLDENGGPNVLEYQVQDGPLEHENAKSDTLGRWWTAYIAASWGPLT